MRTTLALDDELVREAQRLTGTTEKSASMWADHLCTGSGRWLASAGCRDGVLTVRRTGDRPDPGPDDGT